MERTRFRRVKQLFQQAAALPPVERERFVDRACEGDPELAAEVRDLLGHAQAAETGFLEGAGPAVGPGTVALRVPGYEIVEQLAAGASGSVFRAMQAHPRREVALKVLRVDSVAPGQIARFRREAQILAELDHPGIARVIESGVLEDGPLALPWIALEFVQGVTLDAHLAAVRPELVQLLELHAQVCDAVEHAHRRGVVHRDLKPSNVMVDREGRPRVIDFGIARAADALDGETTVLTRTGMLIGTLSTMAPEQARGERLLSPAADVYSLGAMLYESLASRPPVDLDGLELLDAVRAVCDEEPVPLRRLRPDLPRDLETILAKALEKDPRRRYESAGQLGDELRRHVAREPVLARRATVAYRLHRLVRRNPALFLSLAAVMVALTAGLGFALAGLREARRQSARTHETLETLATKMQRFTTRLGFGEDQRGDLEDVLALVTDELGRDPTSRPLRTARARLLTQLALLDQAREDHASMEARIGAAREAWEALAREDPGDLEARTSLSAACARQGEAAGALGRAEERDAWFARALELDEGLVREHPDDPELIEDLGWSLERVARTRAEAGDLDEAERLDRRRLADAEELVRREPRNWKYVFNLSNAHYYLAGVCHERGDSESALEHSREGVRQARLLCEVQPERRQAILWLAQACDQARTLLRERGDIEAARQYAVEALDRAAELLLGDPNRADHLAMLRIMAGERIDLETGPERLAIARATCERLERIASWADASGNGEAADRVRAIVAGLGDGR